MAQKKYGPVQILVGLLFIAIFAVPAIWLVKSGIEWNISYHHTDPTANCDHQTMHTGDTCVVNGVSKSQSQMNAELRNSHSPWKERLLFSCMYFIPGAICAAIAGFLIWGFQADVRAQLAKR